MSREPFKYSDPFLWVIYSCISYFLWLRYSLSVISHTPKATLLPHEVVLTFDDEVCPYSPDNFTVLTVILGAIYISRVPIKLAKNSLFVCEKSLSLFQLNLKVNLYVESLLCFDRSG